MAPGIVDPVSERMFEFIDMNLDDALPLIREAFPTMTVIAVAGAGSTTSVNYEPNRVCVFFDLETNYVTWLRTG